MRDELRVQVLGVCSRNAAALLLVLPLLCACAKDYSEADYKVEAQAVCEAFNPKAWRDLPADIEPYEPQDLLAQRLAADIVSEAMRDIVAALPKQDMARRYRYYANSGSRLSGEAHECAAMREYLALS